MAIRKPLVVISGLMQELPAGDTVSGAVAAGSPTIGEALLDFGLAAARKSTSQVVITGQSTILATSIPHVFFIGSSTADHNADEHVMAASVISLVCSVPAAGAGFTIYGISNIGVITGQFKVQWNWS